jgi:selenide,water dikinase
MIAKRTPKEPPAMRCRGCGGKVGAAVLSDVLRRLDVPTGPIVRQGLDRPDDAALLDPAAGPADVLTVDFFQAFIDDPYVVGRVAAINALSDVWATGADPAGAMAMVTVPEGHPRQQSELLYQLLAGALRELTAADTVLLGGHTLEGPALSIGFTVIGQLKGREPMTKSNLRPGDALILTKPLGTGVLLAAHGDAKCRAEWMDAMIRRMLQGNGPAAGLARDAGVTAVTDVTGFGMAVHLLEMLEASGVGAAIDPEKIPLLTGVAELSRGGVRSTLFPSNRDRAESGLEQAAEPAEVLFDPQTSGGLLIGIAPGKANDLVTRLREAEYPEACVIGRVTESEKPVLSFRRGKEK